MVAEGRFVLLLLGSVASTSAVLVATTVVAGRRRRGAAPVADSAWLEHLRWEIEQADAHR